MGRGREVKGGKEGKEKQGGIEGRRGMETLKMDLQRVCRRVDTHWRGICTEGVGEWIQNSGLRWIQNRGLR